MNFRLQHTIGGMFHHSGYASSCKSCIPSVTWYGCASKGLRRDLPLQRWKRKHFSDDELEMS